MSARAKAFAIIIGAAIIAAFDALFKWIAISQLPDADATTGLFLRFALHKNPGITFDINIPLGLIAVLTVIIASFLIYYAKKHYKNNPILSAFALCILLGALNNFLDRIINGFTTDYIILFNLSAINLSDILILIGTAALLSYSNRKEHR